MAAEAIIAKELGLACAALCSVDNYCNGVAETPLTMEMSSRVRKRHRGNHDDNRQHVHRKEPGMKHFSKKGDTGETSLLGGQRVPSFDPRPEAYGTLGRGQFRPRGGPGNDGQRQDQGHHPAGPERPPHHGGRDVDPSRGHGQAHPEDRGGRRRTVSKTSSTNCRRRSPSRAIHLPGKECRLRSDRRGPHGHPQGRAPGGGSRSRRGS